MSDRPNIIFINTDQHTWNVISAYGNAHVKTPNIDRLHNNGISFMKSYSSDPVCAPARASWMTGRFTSEAGTPFNGGYLHEDIPDLGPVLKVGGYKAVHCGKWHVDGRDVHSSFDVLYHGQHPIGAGGAEYYDPAITHACVDFLTSYDGDDPFYMQAWYVNPHDICEYGHNFETKEMPDAVTRGQLVEDELPPFPENFEYDERETVLHQVCRRIEDCLIHWPIMKATKTWDENQWRTFIWSHHRFVEKVDGEIGLILTAVEQSGLADNTLIIFSVDHGEAFGELQMFQKFSLYEASIRVPFIVSCLGDGLNVPKGVFDETHFVSGVDLVPTVCDYAGIEPPENMRGASVRSLVEGRETDWRDFAFVESNYWGRSLIFDRYKYVAEYIPYGNEEDLQPPGPDPERIGLEQIFDLQEDPGETRNLAFDEDKRELLMQCRQTLLDFEAGLDRRYITNERPIRNIHNWGQRIRAYWDEHPEFEEMKIR